jgi:hypothetical protein
MPRMTSAALLGRLGYENVPQHVPRVGTLRRSWLQSREALFRRLLATYCGQRTPPAFTEISTAHEDRDQQP